MIHVVGDSHQFIFKEEDGFRINDFYSPVTAYRLIDMDDSDLRGGTLISLVSKRIPDSDMLVVSAGEIDCRIHMFNAHKKHGKPLLDVVKDTIDMFIKFLKSLDRKNLAVLGIPPAGDQGNSYNAEFYPTPEEQAGVYKMFHEETKKRCELEHVKYVDMYSETVENGHMKKEYKGDDVHLNKKAVQIARRQLS